MEIRNSYLIWVGAEHYAKIEDYNDETISLGISKRLPNANVAQKLIEPDTLVFVAHDEHEYDECPACIGEIENPERRLLERQWERLLDEATKLREEAGDVKGDEEAEKQRKSAERRALNREKKAGELARQIGEMPHAVEGGTGGQVKVDGKRWDYRKFNYWLHQPTRWDPDTHTVVKTMCEDCGGTGRLPKGKVFGVFLPERIEYILKPEDDEKVREAMKAKGVEPVECEVVAAEPKRGCGKRRPGGYYVVTRPVEEVEGGATTTAREAADKLIAEGVIDPEDVDLEGSFIRFLSPIPIDGVKRFRGIKRWSLDPRAEAEAEMILEAAQ